MMLLALILSLVQTHSPQPAKVYGTIYITSNRIEADVKVYNEPTEHFSDLNVFRVQSGIYANKPGLWHLTKDKLLADHVVYFESDPGFADFRMHYVESEIFAGVK